ncbi:MAG: DUF4004 family protein [Clostridium sp.]
MEEKLISKKELLEETDISYGQLYRWKRKNIIPEEWFIKKSAKTGQETYFPKEKILNRIEEIKKLKDILSLDQLAEKFSGKIKDGYVKRESLIENKIISEYILEKISKVIEEKEKYNNEELLYLIVFNNILNEGSLGINESLEIIEKIKRVYKEIKEQETLIIKKKENIIFYYLTGRKEEILKDDSKVLIKIDFTEIKEYINKLIN